MNEDKLKIGVLCGGRTSGRTYEQFVEVYKYAKENGFTDIEYTFIDPELYKLQQRIDKAIEYIENTDYKTTFYMQEEEVKELLEILKGEENE